MSRLEKNLSNVLIMQTAILVRIAIINYMEQCFWLHY